MNTIVRSVVAIALFGVAAGSAAAQEEPAVSEVEYEGWRQYNVHCARCHGQDALPNPVAANLLVSLAPDGPSADKATFTKIVIEGRTSGGMPAFKGTVEPAQVEAMYAYLKGRAEKRIPPGRPKSPSS